MNQIEPVILLDFRANQIKELKGQERDTIDDRGSVDNFDQTTLRGFRTVLGRDSISVTGPEHHQYSSQFAHLDPNLSHTKGHPEIYSQCCGRDSDQLESQRRHAIWSQGCVHCLDQRMKGQGRQVVWSQGCDHCLDQRMKREGRQVIRSQDYDHCLGQRMKREGRQVIWSQGYDHCLDQRMKREGRPVIWSPGKEIEMSNSFKDMAKYNGSSCYSVTGNVAVIYNVNVNTTSCCSVTGNVAVIYNVNVNTTYLFNII